MTLQQTPVQKLPASNLVDPQIAMHPDRQMVVKVMDLLRSQQFDALEKMLQPSWQAYASGTISDWALERAWPHLGLQRADLVEPAMAWSQTCPGSYAAQVFAAALQCNVAWQARGSNTGDKTSAKQYEVMQQHFDAAFPCLHRALALTPRPTLAIGIGLVMSQAGQEDPQNDYGALAHNFLPYSPLLYDRLMWSLNPKWGGSTSEMQTLLATANDASVTNGWGAAERAWVQACYEVELADVASCEGYAERALSLLKDTLKHQLHCDTAHAKLAFIYNYQDQMRLAIDHMLQALRLSPSANRLAQLGDYYQETGQHDLALAYFEEAMLWGSADAAGSMTELLSDQLQRSTSQQRPVIEQKIAYVAEYGLRQFSSETMFYLGSIEFFQRTDAQAKSRAYQWWRQAAQWGHRTALLNLGLAHFDGIHGQALNKPLAVGYFTEAAKLGNINAHEHLGRAYLRGDGVAINDEFAAYHLEIAADNDNVYAMRDWAYCLWMGRGTPQDREAAYQVLHRLKQLNPEIHRIALERVGLSGGVMTWLKNIFSRP